MNQARNSRHDFRFTSNDGLQISCSRWESSGPARAILQLAHGLGEHSGRYSELIAALNEAGFVVYANDHRGHGRTAATREQRGDLGQGGFDLLVDDMFTLSLLAKQENPGKPFLLFGHSMGSFAAQQYVLDHSPSIDGLVLSGSGILDGVLELATAAGAENRDFLNSHFKPARTPFDWLSRDPRVADAFMADPLCFAALQPSSAQSFLAASVRLADPLALSKIRPELPIYIFSGSDDPVGQQLEGVRILIGRYQKAGLRNIAHHFYEGGRHEMLNELNREQARSNLLAWLSVVLDDSFHLGDSL
jgi:alpha-beta hydrolase superfamily lysophospholipase